VLFVLHCLDRADAHAIRANTREAHLAYAREHAGMIRLAGPLLDDDGETMVGSVFVVEADDAAAVQRFHRDDPYTRAGLFERVDIHPFRWLLGDGPG
jgi:hypothetical protein